MFCFLNLEDINFGIVILVFSDVVGGVFMCMFGVVFVVSYE